MSKLKKLHRVMILTVTNVFVLQSHVFAATANPYQQAIIDTINDIKGWILALVAVVTGIVVVRDGMKYQAGTTDEKTEAVKAIRNHLIMGAAIFIIAWVATWIVGKFASVKPV